MIQAAITDAIARVICRILREKADTTTVGMQFYFPEWKVVLRVYQKEREDNEQGAINED